MRTCTGIPGQLMLAAVPGEESEHFVDALGATLRANRDMEALYQRHRAQLAAASSGSGS